MMKSQSPTLLAQKHHLLVISSMNMGDGTMLIEKDHTQCPMTN